MQETIQTPPNRSDQISFARHNFDNLQSLIRFADAKAGFFASFLLFLAASTFPVGKDAIPKLRWIFCAGFVSSGIYLLSFATLSVAFIWSFVLLFGIVAPRRAKHYRSAQVGHELLYHEHVAAHRDNDEYHAAVLAASPELILRNLTDQIYELGHICRRKMDGLNGTRIPISIAFCAWILNGAFGLWIVGWK
jgi:hypothetical protein